MPPKKSSAAVYAQMRRDTEMNMREELMAVLPKTFLTTEIEEDSALNPTTKVLLAAKNFITSLDAKEPASSGNKSNRKIGTEQATPFLIPYKLKLQQPEDLRQLRQAAQRLVHKAEESVQASKRVSEELKSLITVANDKLIDLIEEVEHLTAKSETSESA